jgi:hypothetical protein
MRSLIYLKRHIKYRDEEPHTFKIIVMRRILIQDMNVDDPLGGNSDEGEANRRRIGSRQ